MTTKTIVIPKGKHCSGCNFLFWDESLCEIFMCRLKYIKLFAAFEKCQECLDKTEVLIEYQE